MQNQSMISFLLSFEWANEHLELHAKTTQSVLAKGNYKQIWDFAVQNEQFSQLAIQNQSMISFLSSFEWANEHLELHAETTQSVLAKGNYKQI